MNGPALAPRLAALAVVAALAGCGSVPPAQVPLAPLTISEAHADTEVTLAHGQHLIVRLASNPTTGYRWALRDSAEPILVKRAEPGYEPGGAPAGMVGAGGTETWRLAALRTGTQDLTFEYRRPWEQGVAPARTISFRVSAR